MWQFPCSCCCVLPCVYLSHLHSLAPVDTPFGACISCVSAGLHRRRVAQEFCFVLFIYFACPIFSHSRLAVVFIAEKGPTVPSRGRSSSRVCSTLTTTSFLTSKCTALFCTARHLALFFFYNLACRMTSLYERNGRCDEGCIGLVGLGEEQGVQKCAIIINTTVV